MINNNSAAIANQMATKTTTTRSIVQKDPMADIAIGQCTIELSQMAMSVVSTRDDSSVAITFMAWLPMSHMSGKDDMADVRGLMNDFCGEIKNAGLEASKFFNRVCIETHSTHSMTSIAADPTNFKRELEVEAWEMRAVIKCVAEKLAKIAARREIVVSTGVVSAEDMVARALAGILC